MEDLGQALKNYIKSFDQEALLLLIDAENKRFYYVILKLLSKNGVHRDRFPFIEFPALLFMILNQHREELIVLTQQSENFFNVISRVVNLILRDINRGFYRIAQDKQKHIKDQFVLDNIAINDKELREIIDIDPIMDNYANKEKLVVKLYFGIDRPYRLTSEQIYLMMNVSKSTLFRWINKLKQYGGDQIV